MRLRVTAATVLLAVTGCSGTDDSAAPTSPGQSSLPNVTSTPTESPDPTTSSPARPPTPPSADRLRDSLVDLDTGRFRADLALDGSTVYREGSYRISDQSSTITLVIDYGTASAVTYRLISSDGIGYLQIDDGRTVRMRQCWGRFSPEALAESIFGGGGSGLVGLVPEISALLSSSGQGRSATAPLFHVAGMFGGAVAQALGVTLDSPVRVPITVRYDDEGVRTGWGTTAGALVDAAARAGLEPDDVGPARTPIDVTLDRFGESVFIEAPRREFVIPFDIAASGREIGRSVAACEAR